MDRAEALGLALDETDGAVLEGEQRIALVAGQRHLDDLRPVRGDVVRLRALDLDAEHALGHVGPNEIPPFLAAGRPGAHAVVATDRMAELDEGRATVARMQLHVLIAVAVDYVGGADAHAFRMLLAAAHVVRLED